ncbi:MAG: transcriptional regulator [Desulfomonile sp.]
MDIQPIRTEADYEAALARTEQIWDAEPETQESAELDVLSILIEDYEEKHYPIPPPDPIEAIKFRVNADSLSGK